MIEVREQAKMDLAFALFLGLVIIVSFPANLMRLQGFEFFSEIYPKLILVLLLFFAVVNSLKLAKARIPKVFLLFLFVWVFFFWYLVFVGNLNNNPNPLLGLKYFLVPFFVLLVLIGRRFLLYFYSSIFFWRCILVTHIILVLVYFFFLYGSIYPGIGVSSLAYSSLFFLINGNPFLFSVSFLIVFFEGKRSILLSLLLTCVFFKLFNKSSLKIFFYILLYSIVSLLIFGAILYFISQMDHVQAFNRINLINPFSSQFNLLLGSSGRYGEIVSAFKDRTVSELFFGMGSGFQYQWDLGYQSGQSGETKGYLHFSPANYLLIGGVWGVVIFIFMSTFPLFAKKLNVDQRVKKTAFSFGIFSIFQSFFGFNFATDVVTLVFVLGPATLAYSLGAVGLSHPALKRSKESMKRTAESNETGRFGNK